MGQLFARGAGEIIINPIESHLSSAINLSIGIMDNLPVLNVGKNWWDKNHSLIPYV